MTTKKPRKSLGDTLADNFVYGISSIPVTDPLEEVTIFTDEIDKLLRGNKVLYVIIHQYQLENIYS